MKARCPDCRDPICDSVGKFAILGRGESNDAQTVSGLSHSALKKAIYKHVLWECSPLFGFPNRVIDDASPFLLDFSARLGTGVINAAPTMPLGFKQKRDAYPVAALLVRED